MKAIIHTYAFIHLLVGMASPLSALAASTGIQYLGTAPNVIDAYTFKCPKDAISAQANVSDHAGTDNIAARMRVMLLKDGAAAQAEDLDPTSLAGEGGRTFPGCRPCARG